MDWLGVLRILLATGMGAASQAHLIVTEVMYDPASNEDRWEWIEIYNPDPTPIDLDGYVIDRVGDRERAAVSPNIAASPVYESRTISNPTVVPGGGIAILYNGPALGYSPERFRSAWRGTPSTTPLIGVEGWSSNQLTNAPSVSDYAPSLPALTVGLWPNETAYRQDVVDFGDAVSPDRRVYRTDHATAAFGYDDDSPWSDTLGRSSLGYVGGDPLHSSSWTRTAYGAIGTSRSSESFVLESISGDDFGSPGVPPAGVAASDQIVITEMMINPDSITGGSKEWEWVELYNPGPTIDFGATPFYFDDDDGSALATANVNTGQAPSGGTVVLFNAAAVSTEAISEAWRQEGEPDTAWIPVADWPALANSGDAVAIWGSAAAYNADRLSDSDSTASALVSIAYDDSSPWPSGVNGEAIRLTELGLDPAAPSSWARARGSLPDPNARQTNEVFAPSGVVDNVGGEEGSPGYFDGLTLSLAGDYNDDGRVDAADYTLWRNGGPLQNESVSPAATDQADFEVWRANFSAGTPAREAQSVPEPATLPTVVPLLACFIRRSRPACVR